MKSHKDLDVWKKAMELAEQVYKLVKAFPKEEMYGLTAQIKRSVVSVPSNIAEGAARNSRKEFMQFLYVALGSNAEVETQLLLAGRLGYPVPTDLFKDIDRIRQMLLGLIHHVREREK
jgi:four helix bundle protein